MLTCPACHSVPDKTWKPQILRLFGDEIYDLYGTMSTEFFLSKQENRLFCPKQSCGSVFLVETKEGGIITCPVCYYQFCANCNEEAHQGECSNAPNNDYSMLLIARMKVRTLPNEISNETFLEMPRLSNPCGENFRLQPHDLPGTVL